METNNNKNENIGSTVESVSTGNIKPGQRWYMYETLDICFNRDSKSRDCLTGIETKSQDHGQPA